MSTSSEPTAAPTRLGVVGTDLKFMRPLIARFEQSGRFQVRVDEWPKFRVHDLEITNEVLAWAEVVVCEWAGPNAVLASRSRRPGQRIVVRLHRMELSHPEWKEIDIDAIDLVVTVGPYYRRKTLEVTGWPEGKVTVIPNFVDEKALTLPKEDGARFNLGMIGVASSRKRLDFALDVLAEIRIRDERYTLFVKGDYPWGLKWVEDRPEEVEFFATIRRRLDREPALKSGVVFDPAGPDVGDWLRKIGFILSTSDDESFHLSPAEGMTSGAVPVIRGWPGADEIYDQEWILADPAPMADKVLAISVDDDTWRSTADRARREMLSKYRLDDITDTWLTRALTD